MSGINAKMVLHTPEKEKKEQRREESKDEPGKGRPKKDGDDKSVADKDDHQKFQKDNIEASKERKGEDFSQSGS